MSILFHKTRETSCVPDDMRVNVACSPGFAIFFHLFPFLRFPYNSCTLAVLLREEHIATYEIHERNKKFRGSNTSHRP